LPGQLAPQRVVTRGDAARALTVVTRLPGVVSPWLLYSEAQRWIYLTILFLVTVSNFFDYFVLSVLIDPIKQEFRLSDTQLGLLGGVCFALFYAAAAIPISRWSDRGNRRSVITVALIGWSAMTVLCGFARSFWQLVVARFGVGLMEPGAQPPAQSLVIDYFPPERRGTAIAVLVQGGSAVGWLVGVSLGGYIAATHGWRAAFLAAGVPGIVLAIVARWTLAEPRCVLGFERAALRSESSVVAFRRLREKRTFLFALLALSIYIIFSYGIGFFLPSFIIRSLHATLEQVSSTWGFFISAANLLGAIAGGWLADYLGKRDMRWYTWLPALACVVGAPLYWLALASEHLWTFIKIDFLAEFALATGLPAIFVAIHSVCGSARRATATAIVFFALNLFGSGLGPLVAGALSDAFASSQGTESLRYSLYGMVLLLAPAAVGFCAASRTIFRDCEA
jgi:MFS family permease